MAPTRWHVPAVHAMQTHADTVDGDEYDSAHSEFNPAEALHSTEQFYADKWRSAAVGQVLHGAADQQYDDSMSIEIGRGLQAPAHQNHVEDSSQVPFVFGHDSQYELTGTPPVRGIVKPQHGTRKPSRANESAKRSTSQTARVLSDLSGKIRMQEKNTGHHDWDEEEQATATLNAKSTRFGNARRLPSPRQYTHQPQKQNNASAYDTVESFQLPDISGIEELVNGKPAKDRSNPRRPLHHNRPISNVRADKTASVRRPVQSVPIPEDEKRIYSSLQHLRDRIAQLESEKASAWSQLAEYEDQIAELQSALAREEQLRRPDSALGSDEETHKDKWRLERTRLQASARALRQQLAHAQRKNHELTEELATTSSEKDNLATQLGVECFRLATRESELQSCREENAELLRARNDVQQELAMTKEQLSRGQKQSDLEQPSQPSDLAAALARPEGGLRRSNRAQTDRLQPPRSRSSADPSALGLLLDQEARQSIATAVQYHLDRLTHDRESQKPSVQRKLGRSVSQPLDLAAGLSGVKSSARAADNLHIPAAWDVDDSDLTELSDIEPAAKRDIRQALEQVRLDSHRQRQSSAPASIPPAGVADQPEILHTTTKPRRSSLRSAQPEGSIDKSRAEDVPKPRVRVQSPTLQNTGHEDDDQGDTSDIILPDLTLQRPVSTPAAESEQYLHNKDNCTSCTASHGQHIDFPLLDFVSSRSDLTEDATMRPSQTPYHALSMVVKHLLDEKTHLHLALRKVESEYHAHDPAIGQRARIALLQRVTRLRSECERKDQQIYGLYDALEAHKGDLAATSVRATPAVISTQVRAANPREKIAASASADLTKSTTRPLPSLGLDGADDDESVFGSIGLPDWDGLSEQGV